MRLKDITEEVKNWVIDCFNQSAYFNRRERGLRFIEEAIELVQALGLTHHDVCKVSDRTFNRPSGTIHEEIGGCISTLAMLAGSERLDMEECYDHDRDKRWSNMDAIRAKQEQKALDGTGGSYAKSNRSENTH